MIRSPFCNFNPETTVLCHTNGAGIGTKQPDLLGAWGCSACHDYVDGRTRGSKPWERRLALLIGMERTLAALIEEGKIKW